MTHPAIAALDRQLAKKGEPVVLRRTVANAAPIEATVRGFCRGYRADELLGGIQQGDSAVILSPTEIQAAGWPVPPKTGDKVIYQGRTRNVQSCAPVAIGTAIVRYDIVARG